MANREAIEMTNRAEKILVATSSSGKGNRVGGNRVSKIWAHKHSKFALGAKAKAAAFFFFFSLNPFACCISLKLCNTARDCSLDSSRFVSYTEIVLHDCWWSGVS